MEGNVLTKSNVLSQPLPGETEKPLLIKSDIRFDDMVSLQGHQKFRICNLCSTTSIV